MTIEELGKKTKAKYSQYKDFSDREIGDKILAKYPQYQNMITDKGFMETVKGAGEEIKAARESGMSGMDMARGIARDTIASQGRNIGKEEHLSDAQKRSLKLGEAAETVMPVVAGTIGRLAGGRNLGAVGTGAGQAVGTAIKESTQNVAGVQEDSPLMQGGKPLVKGVAAASIDYATDVAMSKISAKLNPIFKKSKAAVGRTKPGAFVAKKAEQAKTWLSKMAAKDMVAEMRPNKSIRKTAFNKDLELSEVFRETTKDGKMVYGPDIKKNITTNAKLVENNSKIVKRYLNLNKIKTNVGAMIDDVVDDGALKAGSFKEEQAMKNLGEFLKKKIIERNGSLELSASQILDEKILAGSLGFRSTSDVVDTAVGKTYSDVSRKFRERMISMVGSKANKQAVIKFIEKQEKDILMGAMFKEAAINQAPKTIARQIGRMLYFPTLVTETIGKVASQGVQSSVRPTFLGRVLGVPGQVIKGTARAGAEVAPSVAGTAGTDFVSKLIGK